MEMLIDVKSDLLRQVPARFSRFHSRTTTQQPAFPGITFPGVSAPGTLASGMGSAEEGVAVEPGTQVQPAPVTAQQPLVVTTLQTSLVSRQMATLEFQIAAVKVFLLLMAARGLEARFSQLQEAQRDFVWHRQLIAERAALDDAFALIRSGTWLEADAFQLHLSRDLAVRFDDLMELQIVSAAAGTWTTRISNKWKEFTSAELKDQATILASTTIMLQAAAMGLHWWLSEPELPAQPPGTTTVTGQAAEGAERSFRIALNLPLQEAANALLLEQLSQERAQLYDPGQGGTRDLQSALTRLGFDPGKVDGERGPKTRAAEAAAAEAWGLPGLGAEAPTFRLRLARELLLLEAARKAETGLG